MSAPAPEIAGQIDDLAQQLHELDAVSARRLRELGTALTTENGRQRWSDVDLRRAFNTDRLALAWAVRREGGYAPASVDVADKLRNVLVLVPVLLTWFALGDAASRYQQYLRDQPDQSGTPFLVLWQQGFGGGQPWYSPTFSTVALIDTVIIAIIIMLTFYAHGRREHQEDKIADAALLFQADFDNALAEAGVLLATDKSSRPIHLADSVERLAESFATSSSNLLNQLQVEHDRLDSLAARREKEFADFGVFAASMRSGAESMHRLIIDLRDVAAGLERSLEDLSSDVSRTGDQQRALLTAVASLEKLTSTSLQADQSTSRQLAQAATLLAETADVTITGAESAAQAGRAALDAVKGMGDVVTKIDDTLSQQGLAHAALAETIRKNADGGQATVRHLEEIGANLTRLGGEFDHLSRQNNERLTSLQALMAQQAESAREMSGIAREIANAGMSGSQQQRQVNQELSHLIQRLDGLANSLNSVARQMPNTDALQTALRSAVRAELGGRPDGSDVPAPSPARWTRTRS